MVSSDDRLRDLLEELRPPRGFDVDGDLAVVRRRAARRSRGRTFVAAAAVVALLAGTVAIVTAVRHSSDGGVAGGGGGGGPGACVPGDDDGVFKSFATGSLPNGQHYELRSRGESAALDVELWIHGKRTVSFPIGADGTSSALVRIAQNDVTGGVPIVVGRAPAGRSIRITFEDGNTVEYPLVDGLGGRRWFVGIAPSASTVQGAAVVGTDGSVRDVSLLTNLPECVAS